MTPQDLATRRQALTQTRDVCDLLVAQQYTPYADEALVRQMEHPGLLQMFQLAEDEDAHVEILLDHIDLGDNPQVLDLGCGTGQMAALMSTMRPDLRWTLLNKSLVQLGQCPHHMARVGADLGTLPFVDRCFDGIFCTYSLGYGAIDAVFAECSRVLAPGGELLLYDLICRASQADTILLAMGYKVYTWDRLNTAAKAAGLTMLGPPKAPAIWLHPAFRALPAWLLDPILTEVEPLCLIGQRRYGD